MNDPDAALVFPGTDGNTPTQPEGAVPLNAPMPRPRPAELTEDAPAAPVEAAPQAAPDRSLGMALHGGLTWLSKTLGLDKASNAALPGTDPDQTAAHRALASTSHAMSPDEVATIENTVDPQKTMEPSVRRIAGMNGVYEYYLNRGEFDKADKMAAAMIQASKLEASKYGHMAISALKNGDPQGAAKAIQAGYDATPDGHKAEANVDPSGNGTFTQKNAVTGAVTQQGRVTPQALMAAAVGLADGQEFYGHIMAAARRGGLEGKAAKDGSPSAAYTTFTSGLKPWTPPVPGAPAAAASDPAEAAAGVPPAAPSDPAEAATPAAATDTDNSEGGGEMAGETSGPTGTATITPTGVAAPSAVGALPIKPMPAYVDPSSKLGPRPVMPPIPAGMSPAEARSAAALFKAQQQDPWDKAAAAHMAEQKANRAAQKDENTGNARINATLQGQAHSDKAADNRNQSAIDAAQERERFTAEQNMKKEKFAADEAEKRRAASDAAAKEREQLKIEAEERKNDKLPTVDTNQVKGITEEVHQAMQPLVAELPNPETGKPFGDPEAATKALGPKLYRGIRDIGVQITALNPLIPSDSAADIAASIVSSDTGGYGKEGVEWDPHPAYSVGKQDKAGNVSIKSTQTGRTFKAPPALVDEIEQHRAAMDKLVKKAADKALASKKSAEATSGAMGKITTGMSGAVGNMAIDPEKMYGGPIIKPAEPASAVPAGPAGPSQAEQDFENEDWVKGMRSRAAPGQLPAAR